MVKTITFFDCNCSIGVRCRHERGFPRFGQITTVKQLLDEIEYYGIDIALVSHFEHEGLDDREKNLWLSKEIAEEDRLYAAWTIIPDKLNKDINKEVLENNKVRAVCLFPLVDRYPLSDWIVGDLFKKLNKLRLITILHVVSRTYDNYTAIGGSVEEHLGGNYRNEGLYWDKVYELANKYPKIPFVLARITGDGGGYGRMIHMLLDKLDNIYIELSNYHCLNSIDDMVSRHGPDRFLFGTWLPFQDPGQTIAHLNYAEISQKDKEMIAGKNFEKLFKEEEI